jgi:flagellin
MAFSVNTNAQAFVALQNLSATNRELSITQNRVSTGLEVAGAQDNAAFYAIAQNLRADVAGLGAVQGSIDNASSALDIALSAGEAVSDILIELEGLAVAAADAGIDDTSRTALNQQFQQLIGQIDSIVNNAEFNGINAVDGSDPIIAITDTTASTGGQITIAAADLSAGGLSISTVSIATAGGATSALAAVQAASTSINSTLSTFGAGANRLEIQATFTQSLSDTIEVGIGNLVDADLAQESANLQALQVQQQLGLSSLSIANQAPGAVLSLFG